MPGSPLCLARWRYDFEMEPNEYHLDVTWSRLHAELAAAQLKHAMAVDAVKVYGYGEGRKEALEQAERDIEVAEQALATREETISDPRWGSW